MENELQRVENNSIIEYTENNVEIKNLIYTIRGKQVMLDSDVAKLFNYHTKDLNRNVKNNIDRFPSEYCFQLTEEEYKSLRCKIFTLKNNGRGEHRKYSLIVDIIKKKLYHCGASIKDLGNKCFGINKIEDGEIIENFIGKVIII